MCTPSESSQCVSGLSIICSPRVVILTHRAHAGMYEDNSMVRIRLRRVGKRKQPHYRVVVADARSPRDGRFIEIIGQYDPVPNPSSIAIDNEKALEWLRKGAQPSEQVKSLLK